MKKDIIKDIENLFGSVNNFFKFIGDTNPAQSTYSFTKTKYVPRTTIVLIECLKTIVDVDIKKQTEIRDFIKSINKS